MSIGSLSQLKRDVVSNYISSTNLSNLSTAQIQADALDAIRDEIRLQNVLLAKNEKYPFPKELTPANIAQILLAYKHIKSIRVGTAKAGAKVYAVGMYDDDTGLYKLIDDDLDFQKLVLDFNPDLTDRDVYSIIHKLKAYADRVELTTDKSLIPLKNGYLDYNTKTLHQYTPDVVFMSKSPVAFNATAQNVHITMPDGVDWNVDDWMRSLSDDPEIVDVLWKLLGAMIRYNQNWGKAYFLYDDVGSGNNGKGTFCQLMRNLLDDSKVASIQLHQFGDKFEFASIYGMHAVITDENDTDSFSSKLGSFKACVTGDAVSINQKNEKVFQYRFVGSIVQCFNGMPKWADNTDSFYRRVLAIPFDKCFTGIERPYIKQEYLHRQDVLEYIIKKVLVDIPDYDAMPEPDVCNIVRANMKASNNPIIQFCDDVLDLLAWDLVPYPFLYDLYKSWFCKNNPSGKLKGKNSFIAEFKNIISEKYSDKWSVMQDVRPANKMDSPEILISQYDLKEWMNPTYRGTDLMQICKPALKDNYSGILRK